jgi:transposase
LTTKFHLAATDTGVICCGFLTGGDTNDVSVAEELTEFATDCFVLADRGYDSDGLRGKLESSNCTPVIPGRKNRKAPVTYDKDCYKKRSFIEILFGKLKENRRLCMRYDKSDLNLLNFIILGFLKISLC